MLGKTGGSWRVLVLDEFTTKTISSVCKVSDVMNQDISGASGVRLRNGHFLDASLCDERVIVLVELCLQMHHYSCLHSPLGGCC